MQYRNEIKHYVTEADKLAICHAMDAVAQRDPHVGPDGMYHIRSLYFDNMWDKALHEKQDGKDERDKYRIRYYNADTNFINLERKSKTHGLCSKISCPMTAEEVQRLIDGDTEWMATSGRGLLIELYVRMKTELLRPRSIVDYDRIPYVYGPGNVRVTLDFDVRSGLNSQDFLNFDSVTIPSAPGVIILEVKWDQYLPSCIKEAVQLKSIRSAGFSKYEAARLFG